MYSVMLPLAMVLYVSVLCVDTEWKPAVGLKDPYWSPTSPTADDENLITSTESEEMRYGQQVFQLPPLLSLLLLLS